MDINIHIEKKHLIIFSVFLLLLLSIFAFSKDVDTSIAYHYLQQIAKGPTGDLTSVDQNENGAIDFAENLTSPTGVSSMIGPSGEWSSIDFFEGTTNMWGIGKDKSSDNFYISRFGVGNAFVIDKNTLNVGIGANPNSAYKLVVNGGASIINNLYLNYASGTYNSTIWGPNNRNLFFQLRDNNWVDRFAFFTRTYGEAMTIRGSGNVGVGTNSPDTKLDVNGEIKLSNTGLICSSATEGSLRYNSAEKVMEYCEGSSWEEFGASSGSSNNDLVGGIHSSQNCVSIGGTVMSDPAGNKFCKVLGYCTDYGWYRFNFWSTTQSVTDSCTCNYYGRINCDSGSHTFANIDPATEVCERGRVQPPEFCYVKTESIIKEEGCY